MAVIAASAVQAQVPTVSTFDQLPLAADTFDNGAGLSGGFTDGDAFFINEYDTAWDVWSGFTLSNKNDRSTAGFANQYSTYARGGAARATGNFMVATGTPTVEWHANTPVNGVYVCNATYTALSMLHGDAFAKKFGGADGNDPDFLKLTAKGYRNGSVTDTAFFYLADYTFTDNDKDYILDYWTYFDLSSLGTIDSVQFSLSSSDNGDFGMNTPGFFCIEDFNWNEPLRLMGIDTYEGGGLPADSFDNGSDYRDGFLFSTCFYPNSYDFDWGTWQGWSRSSVTDTTDKSFSNQYSAIPGGGKGEYDYYMVSYGNSTAYAPLDTNEWHIVLKNESQMGAWFTNTTYTYDQIKNGSNFSKKFGGENGSDPDWFRLIIKGFGPFGEVEGVDTFYLADFRFTDDSKDYIVKDWTYVQLQCMDFGKRTLRMTYELQSSDTGEWGMNTPAYFAMDYNGLMVYSVDELKRRNMMVYPNPAKDFVNIPLDRVEEWEIIGVDGRIYMSGTGGARQIDISLLTPGIYFIRVMENGTLYNGKFIRE